jgi:hypothetical protein
MKSLLVVVFVAILLAVAGLIRVDSPAEAAGGGYASRCGGGKIFLYATEERLLTLHNNARENHVEAFLRASRSPESRPCSFEGHDPTRLLLSLHQGEERRSVHAHP